MQTLAVVCVPFVSADLIYCVIIITIVITFRCGRLIDWSGQRRSCSACVCMYKRILLCYCLHANPSSAVECQLFSKLLLWSCHLSIIHYYARYCGSNVSSIFGNNYFTQRTETVAAAAATSHLNFFPLAKIESTHLDHKNNGHRYTWSFLLRHFFRPFLSSLFVLAPFVRNPRTKKKNSKRTNATNLQFTTIGDTVNSCMTWHKHIVWWCFLPPPPPPLIIIVICVLCLGVVKMLIYSIFSCSRCVGFWNSNSTIAEVAAAAEHLIEFHWRRTAQRNFLVKLQRTVRARSRR